MVASALSFDAADVDDDPFAERRMLDIVADAQTDQLSRSMVKVAWRVLEPASTASTTRVAVPVGLCTVVAVDPVDRGAGWTIRSAPDSSDVRKWCGRSPRECAR